MNRLLEHHSAPLGPTWRHWGVLSLLVFVVLTGSLSELVHAQGGDPPPIDEVIESLQLKYDSVRNFSAEFEHTYAGGVLRSTLVERGTVLIKKPGMMRWSYTTPEEKLFVSDGTTLYSYFPLDRQVIVGHVPVEDTASTSVLFLAGRGNLSEDFTAVYDDIPTAPPNAWMIRLTPLRSNADYERLTLAVDRTSLSITQMIATDFQGAVSTFTFSDLKENEDLPDSLFDFQIPRGTEIITEDSLGR